MNIESFLQNTKKMFLFLRNIAFSDTLMAKSIYQKTSCDRFKFHDQRLAKFNLLKVRKMLTSSKTGFFGQFLEVVGPNNQVKRHLTYIFSERKFYWLSHPFYKTQKTVFL